MTCSFYFLLRSRTDQPRIGQASIRCWPSARSTLVVNNGTIAKGATRNGRYNIITRAFRLPWWNNIFIPSRADARARSVLLFRLLDGGGLTSVREQPTNKKFDEYAVRRGNWASN